MNPTDEEVQVMVLSSSIVRDCRAETPIVAITALSVALGCVLSAAPDEMKPAAVRLLRESIEQVMS